MAFIHFPNAFNGKNGFQRLLGVEDIFIRNSERVRGLMLSCGNGKSEGMGRLQYYWNSLRGRGLDIFLKHTLISRILLLTQLIVLMEFVLYNSGVIVRVISNHPCAMAQLIWNHSPDYSRNCNPLGPITILLIIVAVINVTLIFLTSRFCRKTR